MPNPNYVWGEVVVLEGPLFKDPFAIAYLVISAVTFCGILYALFTRCEGNYQDRRSRMWKYSQLCYLINYSLQILDIVLTEERRRVKEGYIFSYVFRDAAWQFADLAILMIVCRITYYQFSLWGAHSVFQATWRFLCKVFLTILSALALYRWSLTTAYTVLGLNGVSPDWIVRFVHEGANLRTGYQLLYMLVSTFIILLTVYYLGRRTHFREKLNIVEGQFFAVAIILWIRSLAIADIVVKYILQGETQPDYLNTAAEAVYGLPTVLLYLLFNRLNKSTPTSVAKCDILRDGRRTARKELKRRRIDASKGGPGLPTPAQLLAEIESKPFSYLPDQSQRSISSLPDYEVQDTISQHLKDVLKLREKI